MNTMQPIVPLPDHTWPEVISLWETSVTATHHFLRAQDRAFYKQMLQEHYLRSVRLYGRYDETGLVGFLGVSPGHLEMLFVRPDRFGSGVGSALLGFAVKELGSKRLSVNAQNEKALAFYTRFGFRIVSRSETDDAGKTYPVFRMEFAPETAVRL